MADSRWKDIVSCLTNAGYDVYSPGTKLGECKEKYIVVKMDGSTVHPRFSTDADLYAVMCYVPQMQYSTLDPFVQDVKTALLSLFPKIKPYGRQNPSFYEDRIKAHMVSIEYLNYKRVTR